MDFWDMMAAILFVITFILLLFLTMIILIVHNRNKQNNNHFIAFSGAFNIDSLNDTLEQSGSIDPIPEEISNGGPEIDSIIIINYIDFGIPFSNEYIDLRW